MLTVCIAAASVHSSKRSRRHDHFRTERVGKTRTNIYDRKTGEYLCQLLNKEVASWLFRAERAIADEAAFQIERRARRLEIAREYLARRAVREASYGTQLTMF